MELYGVTDTRPLLAPSHAGDVGVKLGHSVPSAQKGHGRPYQLPVPPRPRHVITRMGQGPQEIDRHGDLLTARSPDGGEQGVNPPELLESLERAHGNAGGAGRGIYRLAGVGGGGGA